MAIIGQEYIDNLGCFYNDKEEALLALLRDFARIVRINPASGIIPDLTPFISDIYISNGENNYDEKDVFSQNPSSLLPILALGPDNSDTILDMCAAPGGKLSYMAELAPAAAITAYETSPDRYNRLKRFLSKRELNINLKLGDSSKVFGRYMGYFDKILLDAPCSSDIHQFEQGKYGFFSAKNSKKLAIKQYSLLSSAYMMLKPGGIIVYSTCTMSIYENELVIDKLLSRHEDAVAEELPGNVLSMPGLKRLHPLKELPLKHNDISDKVLRVDFRDNMYEPFFVAKIRKGKG